jgi:phage/plasmid-associated DNA primase
MSVCSLCGNQLDSPRVLREDGEVVHLHCQRKEDARNVRRDAAKRRRAEAAEQERERQRLERRTRWYASTAGAAYLERERVRAAKRKLERARQSDRLERNDAGLVRMGDRDRAYALAVTGSVLSQLTASRSTPLA